jgi:hypothetical protein
MRKTTREEGGKPGTNGATMEDTVNRERARRGED